MMSFEIEYEGLSTVDDFLYRFGLEEGGDAQQAVDNAVFAWNAMYMPKLTGNLINAAWKATKIGSGQIIYPGPYAHYVYTGLVYGPNYPIYDDDSGVPTRRWSPPGKGSKKLTGKEMEYTLDFNPLAGPDWNTRMKADHMEDILQEVRNVINR